MAITDKQFRMLVHLGLGVLYLRGFGIGLVGLAHHGQRFRLAMPGTGLLTVAAWAASPRAPGSSTRRAGRSRPAQT